MPGRSRLFAVLAVAALLAGCGTPPEPLPTTAPQPTGSISVAPPPSFPPRPSAIPTPTPLPTYLPTYRPPVAVPTTRRTPRTTTTTRPAPTTSPAPPCTGGPTREQVLSLVRTAPGVPTEPTGLAVSEGPFCAGVWQLSLVVIQGQTRDPLLVVTRGSPGAITLIAAGGDVCTDEVESGAPPGIRVRACGA